MKTYIKSNKSVAMVFNIEANMCYTDVPEEMNIAAATYRNYEIPGGELMPADKDISPTDQQVLDYENFIASIEEMLTDNHNLELIYKNKSKDYSHYYSFLAKDNEGNVLFRFRLRLRISNHNAKSTPQQKANKSEEEDKIIKPYLQGKSPRKYYQEIVVNDERFYDYFEAFAFICDEVDRWLKVMMK